MFLVSTFLGPWDRNPTILNILHKLASGHGVQEEHERGGEAVPHVEQEAEGKDGHGRKDQAGGVLMGALCSCRIYGLC